MKKYFSLILIAAAVIAGCKKKTEFVVEGKITNASGKFIHLDELKLNSVQPVDSIEINGKGEFKFKGKVKTPTFYLLRLSDNNFITLLIDSVDKVQVYADAANFSRDYAVVGSTGSELVRDLNVSLINTKHKLDSLINLTVLYKNHADYQSMKDKWDLEINSVRSRQINFSTEFVKKHPFSMASVLALYQKFDDNSYVVQDLQSLKIAASALHQVFPKSEHVQALYENTLKLMQEEKNIKIRKYIQENGQNSPDIVLPDQSGNKVALSSCRGKYVLLQFWAAADKASRIQNPVLVELYKKYKSRKFEIYQVSVDSDRYEWTNAIRTDQLSWINVGDMNGSNQAVIAYNIQQVPSNYLLDPEGRLIARDITGPTLNKVLGELLK